MTTRVARVATSPIGERPRAWVIPLAIGIVAVLMRVATFSGYNGSDPRCYAALADDLAHGVWQVPGYSGPPVFPLRFGMYVPTAMVMRFSGVANWVLGIYPLLLGLLLSCIACAIGCSLGSRACGLIAMLVIAVEPCATVTMLWADFCASVWAGVAVLAMILALRATRESFGAALAALAGVLFWVAWTHKESALLLTPFVLALPWVLPDPPGLRRRVVVIACTGLAAGGLLIGEMWVLWTKTGDFLFRFHEIERNYEMCKDLFFHPDSRLHGWKEGEFGAVMTRRLLVDGPKTIFLHTTQSFLPLLATMALMVSWWHPVGRRVGPFLLFWFASIVLWLNFMTVSTKGYRPLPLAPQYLAWLILPGALSLGTLAPLVFDYLTRRAWARAALAAIPLAGLIALSLYQNTNRIRGGVPAEQQVARMLKPHEVVYSDMATVRDLEFYRFRNLHDAGDQSRDWEDSSPADAPNGSLVVTNPARLAFWGELVPAQWQELDGWIEIQRFGALVLRRKGDPTR